ncbi:nitroreductase family protein [Heliobacillus mobilis]|uniref:Nitroreductase family protein n=1 Tax=Heliobacterium mobile TaxID=28064 RepID=A0A6I3SPK7_HELMO|nr:nitroreductase [Heliobacterium mobile]MTV50819.1 nitroreductase family protein [Heliobacterium mobile]
MNLQEAIYERRSVRKYTSQPVQREQILALLENAVQAPSAMNKQPWAFVVIQDKERLKTYSDRAKEMLLSEMDQKPYLARYRSLFRNESYNIFYNAETLIVILAKPQGPDPKTDCNLAAQNLMLAAHGMGLGTCWIGFAYPFLNRPEIKAELGIPPEYHAVAPVIVGYPEEPSRPVKRISPEIVTWVEA